MLDVDKQPLWENPETGVVYAVLPADIYRLTDILTKRNEHETVRNCRTIPEHCRPTQ